jgi:hypothetical protein
MLTPLFAHAGSTASAMAGLGAVLAGASVALSSMVLLAIPDPVTWDLAGRAVITGRRSVA